MRINSRVIGVSVVNLFIVLGFLVLSFSLFEPAAHLPAKKSKYVQAALIGKHIRKAEKQELLSPVTQEVLWATCEVPNKDNRKLFKPLVQLLPAVVQLFCRHEAGPNQRTQLIGFLPDEAGRHIYLSIAALKI